MRLLGIHADFDQVEAVIPFPVAEWHPLCAFTPVSRLDLYGARVFFQRDAHGDGLARLNVGDGDDDVVSLTRERQLHIADKIASQLEASGGIPTVHTSVPTTQTSHGPSPSSWDIAPKDRPEAPPAARAVPAIVVDPPDGKVDGDAGEPLPPEQATRLTAPTRPAAKLAIPFICAPCP